MQPSTPSPCSLPSFIDGEHRFQRAWVVQDLRKVIASVTASRRVGPWFLQEQFTPTNARCYGERTEIVLSVAFTFHGSTMLELMQQHTAHASTFSSPEPHQVLHMEGDRMHHVGIATSQFDDVRHRYLADRFLSVFSAEPASGRLEMLQSPESPVVTELLEWTPQRRALFENIRQAAVGWDGSRPIRPLNSISART